VHAHLRGQRRRLSVASLARLIARAAHADLGVTHSERLAYAFAAEGTVTPLHVLRLGGDFEQDEDDARQFRAAPEPSSRNRPQIQATQTPRASW
jgi:hypothetical protein